MADHFTSSTSYRDHVKTLPDSIETFRNNNLGILLNDIHHYHYTTTKSTQGASLDPTRSVISRMMGNFHQVVASSQSSGSVLSFCERIPTSCAKYLQEVERSLCENIQVFLTIHLVELAVRVHDKHLHISNRRSISFLQASFNDNFVKNTKKLW
ncbi:hypothetical protein K457DRAFT_14984 [Linnemannia elongata AG-77]|uniref:Uncharacterized protein n=1 Tax=Linnemannia elongata AG-77 TaxID=1314771 RepID=A0A197K8G0_9FUNG|nr:hypothetical protein K457DRAFT_14984 [Linnemannia elongata AG-77]